MLLEMAIGDAFGAGYEYVDPKVVEGVELTHYKQHPIHKLVPGSYTDDTQMSLAIAEAIISGEEWTPLNLANRFVGCFKRDQRQGYAKGFYQLLCDVENGEELLARIRPDSDKSGAAMRAAPLGVLSDIAEIKGNCAIQAAITHNTPDGTKAAIAVSLTSHYFLYDLGSKRDLFEFLKEHISGEWKEWSGKVGAQGLMSAKAAFTAIVRNKTLSGLLKDCIRFTGDVDTVAAIAMGCAAHSNEFKKDIPEALMQGLERGKYGRDYLIDLDRQLQTKIVRK